MRAPSLFFRQLAKPLAKLVKRKMDYNHPAVVKYARQLASRYPGEYNISQICYIYNNLRNSWKYVSDPLNTEYIAYASESIKNGFVGDCDDFAVTMASVIAAIGGATRVIFAMSPLGGHAFAEVVVADSKKKMDQVSNSINQHYIGIAESWFDVNLRRIFEEEEEMREFMELPRPWENEKELMDFLEKQNPIRVWAHVDKGKFWLNLDWSSKYPGGPFFRAKEGIIIYPEKKPVISMLKFHEVTKE